ncbi:TonB-dependent siderophore receptor [Pseudidiomarina insulisalsae]|uniref:TonB-dependent siderophore receptor n=1 Tax=Pseudidiomarina insulisalsae TaxID=575789 RepID=A0A432YQH5_9GAMM|nr:TonB-dependent siderophore receptor [Pseudidiomarina insulisalsae]RUO63625.1 TonB-dependent siderophore receptor [Pseudidiomarina insulisalsae]
MRLSVITLSILATTYSLASYASGEPQTTEAVERLKIYGQQQSGYLNEEQQSGSKLKLSIQETPQSITVISNQQMQDFALDDLNSVLENSSTVNVEQVETDRTYYSSRGFELNNFQIDGLGLPLINSNTHGRMDSALYERIEVVHGANGIMTGVGSPAATVNLVRKRPTSDFQGYVKGSLSSWSGKRIEGDVSGAINDWLRARTVVVADQGESYLDRYENRSEVFYGVVDIAPTNNTLITLGHSETRSETDGNMWGALTLFYGDGTPTNFPVSTNIAADWSTWNVEESRSFVDVETALNDYWTLRAAYNRVRTDEDSYLFYTYLPDPATGLDPETGLGLVGYASEYDLDDKQDMFDIYLSGSFAAFGQRHELVVGASHARLDYIDTSLYDFHTGNGFPAMPPLEEWDGDTPFPEFTDGLTGSEIDNTQKAVYAQARFGLTDATKLLVGGRYNDFTTEGEGYGVDQSRDDAQFIPYVGVTHNLTDETTLYASYTETFMAQIQVDRNFERLDPLTGENTEVGIKMSLFGDRALLSAAYFQVQQKNLAVGDGTIENPNTGAPQLVYRAVDGIESKGFELQIAGELAPGLQGTVAATSFNVDGDETVADYTPENLFRASLTYTPAAFERLKLGASFQWQDSISRFQQLVGDSYANAGEEIITRQDAYGRLNLMASYAFNERVMLSLNANNVTDEKYINSLLWPNQGYYGAPSNYSASLTWKF